MKKYINQTLLSIEPEVSLRDFGKVQAFYVKVKCYPAYEGTDKVLMNEVCRILTAETKGDVELKTYYVIDHVISSSMKESTPPYKAGSWRQIEELTFQVVTPLELQWWCRFRP